MVLILVDFEWNLDKLLSDSLKCPPHILETHVIVTQGIVTVRHTRRIHIKTIGIVIKIAKKMTDTVRHTQEIVTEMIGVASETFLDLRFDQTKAPDSESQVKPKSRIGVSLILKTRGKK